MKYRVMSEKVEAVRWDGGNTDEVRNLVGAANVAEMWLVRNDDGREVVVTDKPSVDTEVIRHQLVVPAALGMCPMDEGQYLVRRERMGNMVMDELAFLLTYEPEFVAATRDALNGDLLPRENK